VPRYSIITVCKFPHTAEFYPSNLPWQIYNSEIQTAPAPPPPSPPLPRCSCRRNVINALLIQYLAPSVIRRIKPGGGGGGGEVGGGSKGGGGGERGGEKKGGILCFPLECMSAVNSRSPFLAYPPSSSSSSSFSTFSTIIIPLAGIQREIRDALHARTRESRTIRRFRADKAVNYSPLRALSSATNAQACTPPTRAGNGNS